LARHPEVQQKLRAEVRSQGSNLTFDSIQKLEYLDAVVREALRVHPASPQTERVAIRDDVIPLGKSITCPNGKLMDAVHISAGQVNTCSQINMLELQVMCTLSQIIQIPFKSVNTDASVWGPDAAEFKPERWITPGGTPSPADLPRGWSGLLSFSDGPRNCLGFRLGSLSSSFDIPIQLLTPYISCSGVQSHAGDACQVIQVRGCWKHRHA
jgi:cytochrome P450